MLSAGSRRSTQVLEVIHEFRIVAMRVVIAAGAERTVVKVRHRPA
jgi:hypothetical protein